MLILAVVAAVATADVGETPHVQEHALIVATSTAERVFVGDAARFVDAQRLNPVTTEEINAFLHAEKLKDLVGCEDVACYSGIGGALDIKFAVQIEPNEQATRAVLTLYELFPQPRKVRSKLVSHETAVQSLLRSTTDFRKQRDELAEVLEGVPCGFSWEELNEAIGKPHKFRTTYSNKHEYLYFDLVITVKHNDVLDIEERYGHGPSLITCRQKRGHTWRSF